MPTGAAAKHGLFRGAAVVDFARRLGQFAAMSTMTPGLGRDEPPIARRKLSDQVLDRLTALIASGDYPPGQALPSERELMAAYGVGRPAIREAMQALAHRGWITIRQGGRARVRARDARTVLNALGLGEDRMLGVSPELRAQVGQARARLALGLVRQVAAHISQADLARLSAILDRQSGCLFGSADFAELDRAFHAAIVAVLRNPVLDALLAGLTIGLELESFATGAAASTAFEANQSLLNALRARDPGAAEDAMRIYLTQIEGGRDAVGRSGF